MQQTTEEHIHFFQNFMLMSSSAQIISGYSRNNKAQLISGGRPYFLKLHEMIESARETIHLQVYIFEDDETGMQVGQALMKAAQRGVQVYLLADGYASQRLQKKFIAELRNAGVQFRFFEPLLRSKYFYFGRRMHHKLAVTDTRFALVGGVNICNRYNDMPGEPAWIDFALYAEGEVAKDLCVLCWKTWRNFSNMGITPCELQQQQFNFTEDEMCMVRMRRNDWVRSKNQISRSYIEMFTKANSGITILSSYFLPGRVFRRNMVKAVKRGVKMRVILAEVSDVHLAKHAERYMYDWLLRNGIEIYEFRNRIIHGKLSVCDGEWITVGSYNVNNISAYASIELNLDAYNRKLAACTEQMLEQLIENNCRHITEDYHRHSKNFILQFWRWCCYQLIRIVFYLFTFYFKPRS